MNPIETGLAFLEGLALIFSPCILPVLPLVLSTSAEGGKSRPFGIVIGFVLSFSLFAFASRKLVSALGIDLDIIKNASLLLLFLFGLMLLSSKLSEKFSQWTQGLAQFGSRIGSEGKDGLFSGIMIGALIGLVWTPCAGPILAAVLVQVIRQQTDLAGYLIILSFSIGAGLPMLAIALTGRALIGKLGFLTQHTEALRKSFGVLIIASVLFIASGWNGQLMFTKNSPVQAKGEIMQLQNGLEKPYPAPEFSGISAWLNSPPLTMRELKGKVVLVDFWTYSCINCIRTLPSITAWDKKYRDKGLVIVGVHAPEFEFEKSLKNVTAALEAHSIQYPVALDNELATWANFHNEYWPGHYLIDRSGKVVYTHFGEGEYDVTENNIRFLLGIKDKATAAPETTLHAGQTPETYLGYGRAERFGGTEPFLHEQKTTYHFPATLPANSWALNGAWQIQQEKIVSGEKGAALRLNFTAQKVFLVLGTATDTPLHITLRVNGKQTGTMTIGSHTLYQLVDRKTFGNGLLEIEADGPGLEVYAFTFG